MNKKITELKKIAGKGRLSGYEKICEEVGSNAHPEQILKYFGIQESNVQFLLNILRASFDAEYGDLSIERLSVSTYLMGNLAREYGECLRMDGISSDTEKEIMLEVAKNSAFIRSEYERMHLPDNTDLPESERTEAIFEFIEEDEDLFFECLYYGDLYDGELVFEENKSMGKMKYIAKYLADTLIENSYTLPNFQLAVIQLPEVGIPREKLRESMYELENTKSFYHLSLFAAPPHMDEKNFVWSYDGSSYVTSATLSEKQKDEELEIQLIKMLSEVLKEEFCGPNTAFLMIT